MDMTEEPLPGIDNKEHFADPVRDILFRLGQSLGSGLSEQGHAMKLDGISVTDEEKDLIITLANIVKDNPTRVVSSIKDSPPPVTFRKDNEKVVIQPNLKIFEPRPNEQQVIDKFDENTVEDEYLKAPVSKLVKLLEAPCVEDGIQNHELRQHYERTISAILNLTEKQIQKISGVPVQDTHLDQQFNDWWSNNKYSKNWRQKVRLAMNLIRDFTVSQSLKDRMITFDKTFETNQYSKAYLEPEKLLESVEIMTKEICDTVTLCTKPAQTNQ